MTTQEPTESEEALTHVLNNVLLLPRDSGLRQALRREKFTRIQSVLTITPAMMSSLSYRGRDEDGNAADIPDVAPV